MPSFLSKFNVAPKSSKTALLRHVSRMMFSGLRSSWTEFRVCIQWARALVIWRWTKKGASPVWERDKRKKEEAGMARVHRACSLMKVSRLAPGSKRRVMVRDTTSTTRSDVMFCYKVMGEKHLGKPGVIAVTDQLLRSIQAARRRKSSRVFRRASGPLFRSPIIANFETF